MIPLSDAARTWANAESRGDPLLYLYEIEVTDALTVRLVQGNPIGGPVTFDGETYTPAAISREAGEQSIDGEVGSFRLSISNVDGVAGGYVERYELEDRTVRIISVPRSTLDPADAWVETYSILDQAYNRETATVILGPPNFYKKRVPWRKCQRQRCQWDWPNRFRAGNGCAYPSDEFDDDSVQDLVVGATTDGAQARKHGWWTLNALRATVFDIDYRVPGALYIESNSLAIDWEGTTRDGPFLFKLIEGDFDVQARVDLEDVRGGMFAGILCQEGADDLDSWVAVARAVDTLGQVSIRMAGAENGVALAPLVVAEEDDVHLRLLRVGSSFSAYHGPDGADWTLLGSQTVSLDASVRLGPFLAASSAQSGRVGASFPHFRYLAGGEPDCDRTLESCRVRGNTRRFFAFPGIPR